MRSTMSGPTGRPGALMASLLPVTVKCSTIMRASSAGSSISPAESRRRAVARTSASVVASAFGAGIGKQPRLVIGDQRVDDLVELAEHHPVELVERQVDAMVGHPPLREIIGTDALGAVAGADLQAARFRPLVGCPVALKIIETRAK